MREMLRPCAVGERHSIASDVENMWRLLVFSRLLSCGVVLVLLNDGEEEEEERGRQSPSA